MLMMFSFRQSAYFFFLPLHLQPMTDLLSIMQKFNAHGVALLHRINGD